MDSTLPLRLPPKHLEGWIYLQTSSRLTSCKWKRVWCCVRRNELLISANETDVAGTHHSKILLEQVNVCTALAKHVPKDYSIDAAVKLYNNNEEHVILLESPSVAEFWFNRLTELSSYWARKLQSATAMQELKRTPDVSAVEKDGQLEVSVVGYNRVVYRISISTTDCYQEIFRSIHIDIPCPNCASHQMQERSGELWRVDSLGKAFEIPKNEAAHGHACNGDRLFLLEHGYRLLVVFFSDKSFDVCPVQPRHLTAGQALEIPVFSAKLRVIGVTNAGLFFRDHGGYEFLLSNKDRLFELQGGKMSSKYDGKGVLFAESKAFRTKTPQSKERIFFTSTEKRDMIQAADNIKTNVEEQLRKVRSAQNRNRGSTDASLTVASGGRKRVDFPASNAAPHRAGHADAVNATFTRDSSSVIDGCNRMTGQLLARDSPDETEEEYDSVIKTVDVKKNNRKSDDCKVVSVPTHDPTLDDTDVKNSPPEILSETTAGASKDRVETPATCHTDESADHSVESDTGKHFRNTTSETTRGDAVKGDTALTTISCKLNEKADVGLPECDEEKTVQTKPDNNGGDISTWNDPRNGETQIHTATCLVGSVTDSCEQDVKDSKPSIATVGDELTVVDCLTTTNSELTMTSEANSPDVHPVVNICHTCPTLMDATPINVRTLRTMTHLLKTYRASAEEEDTRSDLYICLSGVHLATVDGQWTIVDQTDGLIEVWCSEMLSDSLYHFKLDGSFSCVCYLLRGCKVHWKVFKDTEGPLPCDKEVANDQVEGSYCYNDSDKADSKSLPVDRQVSIDEPRESSIVFNQVPFDDDSIGGIVDAREANDVLTSDLKSESQGSKAPFKFASLKDSLKTSLNSTVGSLKNKLAEEFEMSANIRFNSDRRFLMSSDLSMLQEKQVVPLSNAINQVKWHFIGDGSNQVAGSRGNDLECPEIGVLVRHQLCNALGNLICTGMKKNSFQFASLFGKVEDYSLWNLVKAHARYWASVPLFLQTVLTIQRCCAISGDDNACFRSFVCELLNATTVDESPIVEWIRLLKMSQQILSAFYVDQSFWRAGDMSSRLMLDDIIAMLMPLCGLPFRLHLEFEWTRNGPSSPHKMEQFQLLRRKETVNQVDSSLYFYE